MKNNSFIHIDNANKINLNTKPSICFNCDGKTLIELKHNGDIFVKGKLIENDKEVVEGMREFLTHYKIVK